MPKVYYRKVFRLPAEVSPNVQLALGQIARGQKPTCDEVVPGVLTWPEYQHRKATWDDARRSVGLDARWYEGPEIKLFPLNWLDLAEEEARKLWTFDGNVPRLTRKRVGKALGIDTAEGGDHTVWVPGDELGPLEIISIKTADTSIICRMTVDIAKQWGIPDDSWVFDRGGGGKEHADRLRADGHKYVRTVAFGETVMLEPKRSKRMFSEKLEQREDRYTYFNRRAQLYGEASLLLDPAVELGFALPPQEWFGRLMPGRKSLREQLRVIPKEYHEGRLKLRPKDRQPGTEETKHKTLKELIDHSPDEGDAFTLMCFGLLHPAKPLTAGAA